MNYRYCPQCGAEYRQGFSRCFDCDVELVDEPPAADEEEKEHFAVLDPLHPDYVYRESDWVAGLEPVVVYESIRDIDAELVLSVLRAEGLRAFSAGTGLLSTYGSALGHGGTSSIRIMVHPEDVTEARALLLRGFEPSSDQAAFEEGEDEYGDDGEDRESVGRRTTRSVALFVLLFGFLPGAFALEWLLDKLLG